MVSTQLYQLPQPPSTYLLHTLAAAFNTPPAASYLVILSCPSLPVLSSANAPPDQALEDVAALTEQPSGRELAVPLHPKGGIVYAIRCRLSACLDVTVLATPPSVPSAALITP